MSHPSCLDTCVVTSCQLPRDDRERVREGEGGREVGGVSWRERERERPYNPCGVKFNFFSQVEVGQHRGWSCLIPYLVGMGSCLLWLGDAMQVMGLTLTPKPPRRHISWCKSKSHMTCKVHPGIIKINHMC